MRSLTLSLLASVFVAAAASPAFAQFTVVVQHNGQASTLSSGSTITFVAPAVGQSDSASVTLTYFGSGSVNFASPAQALGTGFAETGAGTATLTSLQSVTFTITYTASGLTQSAGEFLWAYTQTVGQSSAAGQIGFALVGTVPNVVVGQVTTGGGFVPVSAGGTIAFPGAGIGSSSTVNIAIANTGSAPASISSITVSGTGFSVVALPLLPLSLPAGNQLSVVLQFSPTTSAPYSGSLQIVSVSGTFTATLTGSAVASSTTLVVGQGTGGNGFVTVPGGGTFAFTSTIVGSSTSITIGIYNPTTAAISVNSITATGSAFQVGNVPLLPLSIPAGSQLNISAQFTPDAVGVETGTIQIVSTAGSYTATLSGTGLGGPVVGSVTTSGVFTAVPIGGTFQFGNTILNSPVTMIVAAQNPGTTAITLSSISVSGFGYSILNSPAFPITLPPSGQVEFTVQFLPTTAGLQSGYLQLAFANGTYSAALSGTAVSAVLPAYTFTGASGTQQPFTQPAIGLSLDSPYSVTISGVLTISVASDYFGVDPAVQFATGGLTVAFTIPANTTAAIFPNGTNQIQLQTGTVGSQIVITPSFTVGTATGPDITPANPTTLQLTVPALAPSILTASFTKTSTTAFSVAVTGYTTTRSLTQLTFQFTPRNGAKLNTTSLTIDVSSAAALYFESSSAVGGQFTVTVPFDLGNGGTVGAGTDLTESIASIAVACANATGASNSVTVTVP